MYTSVGHLPFCSLRGRGFQVCAPLWYMVCIVSSRFGTWIWKGQTVWVLEKSA